MEKNSNSILNKSEQKEIISDVKEAINKAKGIRHKSSKNGVGSRKIVFITVFIILLISSLLIYWFLANNPKTIFKRSVDVTFLTLEDYINEPLYDVTKGHAYINIKKADGEYLDYNKYDFNVNYTIDSVNSNSIGKIKTNYDNNHLFDLDIYNMNGKTYLYSLDFFDKYIELDSTINYDSKNIKMMLNSLNFAINEAISGQKITGTRISLTINDKNMYAYKSSLELNGENINLILDNLYEILINDKRFVSSYSAVFNTNNVSESVLKIINNIKNKNINNLIFNVYTEGVEDKFVKLEFIIDNDIFSITNVGKNKYHYMYDLENLNTKYEGDIAFKVKDNDITYKLLSKINRNGNISNLEGSIKFTQTKGDAISEELSSSFKYSELSSSEKEIINNKLNSDMLLKKYLKIK